jgi:hypothetical protein
VGLHGVLIPPIPIVPGFRAGFRRLGPARLTRYRLAIAIPTRLCIGLIRFFEPTLQPFTEPLLEAVTGLLKLIPQP